MTAVPNPIRPNDKGVSVEVLGELINLSGRQRMLSQRIVLQMMLAANGDAGALSVAETCLATFAGAHGDLVAGNDRLPGVFSDALQTLYFGQAAADARVRAFIELARRTLTVLRQGAVAAGALDELVGQATPQLELLQAITQAYQHEMHRCEAAMRRHQTRIAEQLGSISMQANIVALNARISAARAGQYGKEFAVITMVLADIIKEMDQLIRHVVDANEADVADAAKGQPAPPFPARAANAPQVSVAAKPSLAPQRSSPLSRTQSLMHKGVQ